MVGLNVAFSHTNPYYFKTHQQLRLNIYFHRGFIKRLRKIPIFPTRLKGKMDYTKPSGAFYHHSYINTALGEKSLNMKGGFEIFDRLNPQMVGFFTLCGWESPTSLYNYNENGFTKSYMYTYATLCTHKVNFPLTYTYMWTKRALLAYREEI